MQSKPTGIDRSRNVICDPATVVEGLHLDGDTTTERTDGRTGFCSPLALPGDFLDGLRHAADEDDDAGHALQANYMWQAANEIEGLRALVTRLTNVAQDLASALPDPGTEALAAIYCGKNFIYG